MRISDGSSDGCSSDLGVDEEAEQRTPHVGREQSLEDVRGVAATAAARIVRDVGETDGGAVIASTGRPRPLDGFVQRREADVEPLALGPRPACEPLRETGRAAGRERVWQYEENS